MDAKNLTREQIVDLAQFLTRKNQESRIPLPPKRAGTVAGMGQQRVRGDVDGGLFPDDWDTIEIILDSHERQLPALGVRYGDIQYLLPTAINLGWVMVD